VPVSASSSPSAKRLGKIFCAVFTGQSVARARQGKCCGLRRPRFGAFANASAGCNWMQNVQCVLDRDQVCTGRVVIFAWARTPRPVLLQLSLTSGRPVSLDGRHSPALISVCDARRNVRRLLASGKNFWILPQFCVLRFRFPRCLVPAARRTSAFRDLNLPAPAVRFATGRARECNPLAPAAGAVLTASRFAQRRLLIGWPQVAGGCNPMRRLLG